jgi:hypothetical protein
MPSKRKKYSSLLITVRAEQRDLKPAVTDRIFLSFVMIY